MDKACVEQKCIDPCIGKCGYNARCEVRAHAAYCSCPLGFRGDPLSVCSRIPGMKLKRDAQTACYNY